MMRLFLFLFLFLLPGSGYAAQTHLPVPRFVSFKHKEVNVRAGPGAHYPIRRVYKNVADTPIKILADFENYRLIQDQDGDKGWVKSAALKGDRTALVAGDYAVMRRQPRDTGTPMVKLAKGYLVRLKKCEQEYCEVKINAPDKSKKTGWMKKTDMFGVLERDDPLDKH